MKKNLFLLAILSLMAATFVACTSDDDGGNDPGQGSEGVALPTPKFANMAQEIRFVEPVEASSDPKLGKYPPKMNAFFITEDGNVIFELEVADEADGTDQGETKKTFVDAPLKSFDGKNVVLDKNLGRITITEVTRAASVPVEVSMEVKNDIPGYSSVSFVVPDDAPVDAYRGSNPVQNSTPSVNNLCRTWTVLGSIIDLVGDVTVYKEFTGCNLKEICDEAIKHGATMTADERAQFNKSIRTVTVTKTGLFTLNYSDGTLDAADWKWTDSSMTAFTIKFRDDDMGNKFFDNDTKVDVAFKDDRCNLKCSTKITGDKNYNAVLTLQLKAAQ